LVPESGGFHPQIDDPPKMTFVYSQEFGGLSYGPAAPFDGLIQVPVFMTDDHCDLEFFAHR
jgi:hypothetical protein